MTAVNASVGNTAQSCTLSQKYPNPFNPTTMIGFTFPTRSHVALTAFNTIGERIAELVNTEKERGTYNVLAQRRRTCLGSVSISDAGRQFCADEEAGGSEVI
jgi:hypothetical protein